MNKAVEAVKEYARHTTGSERLYRDWTGLAFTDGIKFMAEELASWWLLDVVGSYLPKLRKESFQVWRIIKYGKGVKVEAWSDTPEGEGSRKLISQTIGYTSWPDELLPFEWWVENQTMMLKEER